MNKNKVRTIVLYINTVLLIIVYVGSIVYAKNMKISLGSLSGNSDQTVGAERETVSIDKVNEVSDIVSINEIMGTHRVEEVKRVYRGDNDYNETASDITSSDMIKDTVIKEINLIKSGDKATVEKWYGRSDRYTPEFISEVSSRVVVNFIDNRLTSDHVRLHMCCVQYEEVEEAMTEELNNGTSEEEANNTVAQRILNGEFNRCYNVEVKVDKDGIVPNEEIKTALSGMSYKTVDIKQTECLVDKQRDSLGYK